MTNKMIKVEKLTEDEVKRRLKLIDLDYYNDAYVMSGLLCLFHRGDTCIRRMLCVEGV